MNLDEAIAEVRRAWNVYGDRLGYINEVYRKLLEASVVLADHASQQASTANKEKPQLEEIECPHCHQSFQFGHFLI